MESLGYALAVALLALVPSLGGERAKSYGAYMAKASLETGADPWVLLAIGRMETNWNADNVGACCGGVMSIRWAGWAHWAEAHGYGTDHATLRNLARDPERSISLAAHALMALRTQCGARRSAVLGAYQSGTCATNEYGRRVTRIAARYRARYGAVIARDARRRRRVAVVFPGVTWSFGERVAPLTRTEATEAVGP